MEGEPIEFTASYPRPPLGVKPAPQRKGSGPMSAFARICTDLAVAGAHGRLYLRGKIAPSQEVGSGQDRTNSVPTQGDRRSARRTGGTGKHLGRGPRWIGPRAGDGWHVWVWGRIVQSRLVSRWQFHDRIREQRIRVRSRGSEGVHHERVPDGGVSYDWLRSSLAAVRGEAGQLRARVRPGVGPAAGTF